MVTIEVEEGVGMGVCVGTGEDIAVGVEVGGRVVSVGKIYAGEGEITAAEVAVGDGLAAGEQAVINKARPARARILLTFPEAGSFRGGLLEKVFFKIMDMLCFGQTIFHKLLVGNPVWKTFRHYTRIFESARTQTDDIPIIRVLPILGPAHKPGCNRIQVNVPGQVYQVFVFIHQDRTKTALE